MAAGISWKTSIGSTWPLPPARRAERHLTSFHGFAMTQAQSRRYRLPVVPNEQVAKSRGMILESASVVPAGTAIVLGAGRCTEIPLAELVRRFHRLVVNDIEPPPGEELVIQAGLNAAEGAKIEWQVADLTGMTRPLQQAWELVLADERDSAAAAEAMCRVIETTMPETVMLGSASPQSTQQFDLVVASCILSQLHNASLQMALRLFGERFPGEAERFRTAQQTAAAFYSLAREIEARFIDWLAEITAPGGRIFLSESVQMCFIEPDGPDHWSTEGTLRMTRTTNLADYLDPRFTIEKFDRWNWVADPPQAAGQRGRLFDVQGLIMSVR